MSKAKKSNFLENKLAAILPTLFFLVVLTVFIISIFYINWLLDHLVFYRILLVFESHTVRVKHVSF